MIMTIENRDLFTVSDDYYLAHCISADFGIAKESLTRNICAACQALCDCKDYKIIEDIEFYEHDRIDSFRIRVGLKIYFKSINFVNDVVLCPITNSDNANDIYKMVKNVIDEKYDKYLNSKKRKKLICQYKVQMILPMQ